MSAEGFAPADENLAARKRRLAKARLVAGGAVLFAFGLFALAHLLPLPEFWRRFIGAAGEAGTVGGLADWFAVTALFRHPLGLPIPHTALIPSRKDEIGRSLARFIEQHFLDPALLVTRLKAEDRASQLGAWLRTPEASEFLAARLVAATRGLVDTGMHLDLVDAALPLLRSINEGLEQALAQEMGRRTGPLVPAMINRRLAKAGSTLLGGVIKAVGTEGSAERVALDAWFRARFAEAPPELQDAARAVWSEIQGAEGAAPARPASPELVVALSGLVARAGDAILAAPSARAWINGAIEGLVIDYIVPWRRQIGHYIEEVVRHWDAGQVTAIIELEVGHDLQFIRLNGTAIGALIGVALFLFSWFSGLR